MIPIGAFLTGALLSLLLPVAVLIALSVWYWMFALRVPETTEDRKATSEPAEMTPAPDVPQALPQDPGV